MAADRDVEEEFPNMRPISGPPTLFTFNGIGTALYGKRDVHRSSGAYVATRFFVIVFLPILALDAYRVVRAGSGWHVLGREPLGGIAKLWNLLVASLLLGAVVSASWRSYTTSPDYLAGKQLAEARSLAETGAVDKAVPRAAAVASGGTAHAAAARALGAELLSQVEALDGPRALAALEAFHRADGLCADAAIDAAIAAVAARLREASPRLSYETLDLLARRDPARDLAAEREALLQALVAAEPDEPRWAVALALLHEGRGEDERCEALLAPHAAKIGSGEGARILGAILARRGRHAEAHPLLHAYCAERLQRLKQVESAYDAAYARCSDLAISELRRGLAGDAWYQRYDAADKDEQQRMVMEWVNERVTTDADLAKALDDLREAARIVPVALDLGIVTLLRAQEHTDPEERTRELAAAEETFLAIRGVAGDSDGFRLYYAQVLHWLGRRDESMAEFDALLESSGRSVTILVSVAQALRELGALGEARKLIEEAYGRAQSDEERHGAASLRAHTPIDAEDQLRWLGRCDQSLPQTRIEIDSVMGDLALQRGEEEAAAASYRKALDGYATLPKNSSVLNNSALVARDLYACTGDKEALATAVQRLQEAVDLNPSGTVGRWNLAATMHEWACLLAAAERLDIVRLRCPDGESLLDFCYRDGDEHAAIAASLSGLPAWRRTTADMEQLCVLASTNPHVHAYALAQHLFCNDLAGIRRVADRVAALTLDEGEAEVEMRQRASGEIDARRRSGQELLIRRLASACDGSDATAAAGLAQSASARVALARVGGTADLERAFTEASRAYQLHPSEGAIAALATVASARAEAALAARDARFHAQRERCRRVLAAPYVIASAAAEGIDVADDGCRLAADALASYLRRAPNRARPWHWAYLRALGHSDAAAVGRALLANEGACIAVDLAVRLDRWDGGGIMEAAWLAELRGEDDAARELLSAAAARGVPLPAWD